MKTKCFNKDHHLTKLEVHFSISSGKQGSRLTLQQPFLEEVSAPAESRPKGQSCSRCHHPTNRDLLQTQQHCRCKCTGIVSVATTLGLTELARKNSVFLSEDATALSCQVSLRTAWSFFTMASDERCPFGTCTASVPQVRTTFSTTKCTFLFLQDQPSNYVTSANSGKTWSLPKTQWFPFQVKKKPNLPAYTLSKSEKQNTILIQKKIFLAISHLMTRALHPLFPQQAQDAT